MYIFGDTGVDLREADVGTLDRAIAAQLAKGE